VGEVSRWNQSARNCKGAKWTVRFCGRVGKAAGVARENGNRACRRKTAGSCRKLAIKE
jgi:hypothetical protein